MAYFPIFLQVEEKKFLVVGGGKIATQKLLHLLDFTHNIVLISEDFSQEIMLLIKKYHLAYQTRSYERGDTKGFSFVIVAVDNVDVQAAIYEETRNTACLCNTVDTTNYCDFIFPSYVKKGDLTLAISTSGASPAFAKQLRIYLQALLPDSIENFLQEMKQLRVTLPKGQARMQLFDQKVKEYMKSWKKTF